MKKAVSIPFIVGCLAFAVLANAQVQTGSTVKAVSIGNAAPPILYSSWVKGTPISHFKKGTVYIVDFWATWCPPCNKGFPHLSEIAHKYAGKVQVLGVDVRERVEAGQALDEMVAKFVKDKGDAMDYNLCTDNTSKGTFSSWMTAASEHGIPCAFVIDQNGAVANIVVGYGPGDHRLDDTIDQLLAGTFDYKASASRHQAEIAKAQH